MGAGVLNKANLDAANTAFETAANGIFSNGVPGVWSQFTNKKTHEGTSAELIVVDGVPQAREWLGAKQVKQLRAYKKNLPLRPWEATISVPVDQINGDRTGAVAARVADFARSTSAMYDKIMLDMLIANTVTGYDGVALLSNSHPNVNGTTWDNLEAAALTMALFKTAVNSMRAVMNEGGEPLGMSPTHLLVGPDQEEMGKICTGSDKIFGTDNAGAIGGTVINSAVLRNYIGGSVNLIISERITGNEWFLMDLSKGEQKPLYLAEFQPPTTVIKDADDDDNVFFDDEAIFGIVAKASPCPLNWQCIHGSVTA